MSTDYFTASRNFHTYRPNGLTLQQALREIRINATDENITQLSGMSSSQRILVYTHILQNYMPRGRLDAHLSRVNTTLHWFLVWID
ncbi:MAG: hypothetical protein OXM61_10980 [Candidatus Poribacteria bacterium]|nr:hypothetical protein [Candidatus Poribacteria bacterium]